MIRKDRSTNSGSRFRRFSSYQTPFNVSLTCPSIHPVPIIFLSSPYPPNIPPFASSFSWSPASTNHCHVLLQLVAPPADVPLPGSSPTSSCRFLPLRNFIVGIAANSSGCCCTRSGAKTAQNAPNRVDHRLGIHPWRVSGQFRLITDHGTLGWLIIDPSFRQLVPTSLPCSRAFRTRHHPLVHSDSRSNKHTGPIFL